MISAENSALIIIDIQGKLATLMHEKEHFLNQTRALIQSIQVLKIPIVWAEQLPEKLGSTTPEVAGLLKENSPLPKNTFSCCGDENIKQAIHSLNKSHFIIAGIETHICVYQTVADLLALNKSVHVMADATSSRTLNNKRIGINRMEKAGATISCVEMCLFEIMGHADGAQFKAISKLVL